MKQHLSERIIEYLRKEKRDVKRATVQKIAEKHGYSADNFFIALEVIADTTANVGQWQDQKTKVNYLRWYEPSDMTKQVQECLDRGDDW